MTNNFICEINRDFYEHFFNLLTKERKDELFNGVSSNDLEEMNGYDEILDILGTNLNEIIQQYLHYDLDIYLEIIKDELGNTVPLTLGIGKNVHNNFSGFILRLTEQGYYELLNIGENELLDSGDSYKDDEVLKTFIGTNNFNNALILIDDIMQFDNAIGTYVGVNKAFEENFSNKVIYTQIENGNTGIYLNSTMDQNDIIIEK